MLTLDPENSFHAWTTCCNTHLYEREEDFPDGYALRPDRVVDFMHLDDTVGKVPATVYTGRDGVTWELYIGTAIAAKMEMIATAIISSTRVKPRVVYSGSLMINSGMRVVRRACRSKSRDSLSSRERAE